MEMFTYGGFILCCCVAAGCVMSQAVSVIEENDRRSREEWDRKNNRSMFK